MCFALSSLMVFQFHKGTIKTCSCSAGHQIDAEFQFHKGTIKTGDTASGEKLGA